jgi:hypothetical protein
VPLVYFDSSAFVKLLVEEPGSRSQALRGADAVHLASALAIGDPDLVVAVWDARLDAGVRAAGARVAPAQLGASAGE